MCNGKIPPKLPPRTPLNDPAGREPNRNDAARGDRTQPNRPEPVRAPVPPPRGRPHIAPAQIGATPGAQTLQAVRAGAAVAVLATQQANGDGADVQTAAPSNTQADDDDGANLLHMDGYALELLREAAGEARRRTVDYDDSVTSDRMREGFRDTEELVELDHDVAQLEAERVLRLRQPRTAKDPEANRTPEEPGARQKSSGSEAD